MPQSWCLCWNRKHHRNIGLNSRLTFTLNTGTCTCLLNCEFDDPERFISFDIIGSSYTSYGDVQEPNKQTQTHEGQLSLRRRGAVSCQGSFYLIQFMWKLCLKKPALKQWSKYSVYTLLFLLIVFDDDVYTLKPFLYIMFFLGFSHNVQFHCQHDILNTASLLSLSCYHGG